MMKIKKNKNHENKSGELLILLPIERAIERSLTPSTVTTVQVENELR